MYVCLWGASERKLGKSLNHRIISGCDSPDHKNGAEPALQTCIEVLPNVVRAFRGALPLHPIAPVQPFLRWQPGLCNEERHSNELDNSGFKWVRQFKGSGFKWVRQFCTPPALAFALSCHTVSEAVWPVQRHLLPEGFPVHGSGVPHEPHEQLPPHTFDIYNYLLILLKHIETLSLSPETSQHLPCECVWPHTWGHGWNQRKIGFLAVPFLWREVAWVAQALFFQRGDSASGMNLRGTTPWGAPPSKRKRARHSATKEATPYIFGWLKKSANELAYLLSSFWVGKTSWRCCVRSGGADSLIIEMLFWL